MMESIDPYYSVQEEVIKNLKTAENVYNEWLATHPVRSELTNSMKQLIRGIEWDLEDIQETITIAQNNPSKFRLTEADIEARQQFVRETKNILQNVKISVDGGNKRVSGAPISFQVTPAKPSTSVKMNGTATPPKRNSFDAQANVQTAVLEGRNTRPTVLPVSSDPLSQQELLLRDQNDRLDQLGTSISTLKGMSRRIGDELGDQVALLDEFSSEMVHTESRLDAVTKRTARLLHLSTDKRQWWAIFGLSLTLLIILVLLVVL